MTVESHEGLDIRPGEKRSGYDFEVTDSGTAIAVRAKRRADN
jgi:hypothetical protein